MMPGLRRAGRGAACLLAATLALLAPAASAADPFEIAVILPQTGPGAFLGKEEASGLAVVQDLVNKQGGIAGRPIAFVVRDDQSSPQVAVELMNQIVAKQAQVVIGSTLAAVCNAQAAIARDGPVIYCLSPGVHPAAGSYMFTAGVGSREQVMASVRYLRERNWTKIAVVTSNDATGQDADQNLAAVFKDPENAVETLVDQEHFNTTDLSVAAQMSRIKASGAQALILWSTGTPLATLLRGALEAGLDLPIVVSPGNLTYTQMKSYASFLPKEIYFAAPAGFAPEVLPNRSPMKRAIRTFLEAFKTAGIRPDAGQAFAWEPGLIVVDAFRQLGTTAGAAQIRQFIVQNHSVGIDGRFDFAAIPQRGLGIGSLVVVRWDPVKDTWVGVSKSGGYLH
jgi:branched-chain amino acid transport system substrate-binding protein